MPKKTRKKKIMAEYRRKLKLINQPKIEIIEAQEKKEISKQKIQEQPKKIAPDTKYIKEDNTALNYFYKDLKKSLLFISIIIALEVLLYFVKI